MTTSTRFSEAQMRHLIKLYTDAELDLQREINKALLKGNDLKTLTQLKRNVGIIRQDLLKGARTWTETAIPSVYDMAADETGLASVSGFNAINQQAMKVLADNAYSRFQDVDQAIGRRVDDIYRATALDSLQGQIVGYNAWKTSAKVIRERLAAQGVTGFTDRSGRSWSIKRYSEMVARTTVRETMVTATSNRLLEHGHDLAQFTSGGSSRTCEKCRKWAGKVVSLTGKTPGYPTLAEARADGMLHPSCTHMITIAEVS